MDEICRAKFSPRFDDAGAVNRPGTHYKYQCNYDERRRKAESRRRKLVQKIKCDYRINVDELNAKTVEVMISEVEAFERQKRIRTKAKAERRLCFVRKLLQEEKYKRRGVRTLPALRRPKIVKQTSAAYDNINEFSGEVDVENLYWEDRQTLQKIKPEPEPVKFDLELIKTVKLQKPSETVKETQLECNPSSIIFENCEPNKTYTQTYRITNVGLDIIHCRYIGIHTGKDHAVPFQVAVSDNVLLRPGLSFSSKIHLFSPTEIPELQCHLVYESRRKNKPNQHGIFRILVSSVPGRSIVDVSPSVVRFPSVTWCVATGLERWKYLKKSIRIRNRGTKDCSCVIVKTSQDADRELEIEGEADEYMSDNSDGYTEAIANLAEVIDNVFEVFRFSQRYFIPVPAMSTVTVDVDFIPEYKGYHHDVVFVRFEGSHNYMEEKIELIGDIKKVPLRIEPMMIDLNICTINSGVYEGIFRIYNDSNNSFPVRVKVPGSMKEHSSVFPSCPVIQPRSYQTCSVRLFPRLTIHNDAYRYYKDDTKVLEFPVFIQPTGANSCKQEKMKLYVFAILTDYSLGLQPAEINFGVVNTLETVRTEITLTNHSMTELDYGFLHLPVGVRIEPNFGFGVILPKETISLHLLYSPILNTADAEGNYTFQVEVTNIQELGGFGERIPNTETGSTDQLTIMDEGLIYNTEEGESPKVLSTDSSTTDDEDKEPSFIDPAEELKIIEEKQNRIREYLRQEANASPTASHMDSVTPAIEIQDIRSERKFPRKDANIISCKAILIKPFCRLSATVLQLPATPLSSFSITRLRLNGINPLEKCNCGYAGKLSNRRSFEARFEFATSSDLICIVPSVGHITEGDNIPISIIFKPEFSKEELRYQSKVLKAEMLYEEEMKSKESKSKTKSAKPNRQGSRQKKLDIESQDVNLATLDITPYDLFAGQKALQYMIDPFTLTLKAICKVTTVPCNGMAERAELHSLILIAPVIKPRFIFLGKCQEIRFGKVSVGDRAKKILEIQNISLTRIAPRVSALNPHGPFTCTTGCKIDKVDPEHIWRHPINFAPTGERGKEEEFFEIRCGATTIPLTINGEGVTPKFTLTPNFELCVLEIAHDVLSEEEFNIENTGEADLTLQFVADGMKASSNFKNDVMALDTNGGKKYELGLRKSDRKTSYTAKRCALFVEDVPYDIAIQLENDFRSVDNPPENLFSIIGLDSNDEVVVPPSSRVSLKIKCCLLKDEPVSGRRESSPNISAYAIKYKLMLAKTTLLKEFVIIGTMNPFI